MSNFIKRTLSVTLALLVLFGLVLTPDMAMTVNAATAYNLWVNGQQVTSDKLTIACGTGSAVYDPASTTLTLNSAVITKADADGGAICAVDMPSLTIRLNGTSVITAPGDDAITSLDGTISIEDGTQSGIGALTANAPAYTVYAKGNVNIRGGHLDLYSTASAGCNIKAEGNVNITDGTASFSAASDGSHISAAKIVVTGGSIGADAAKCSIAPVNGGGTAVKAVAHTVPSVTSATPISSLKVTLNGAAYAYAFASMLTGADGKLTLWLPEGAVIGNVTAGEATTTSSSTTSSTTSTTTSTTTTSTTAATTAPAVDYPPYVRLKGNNINLRESAPSGKVIQMLPVFACYPCSGTTKVGDTTWYKITVGTTTGWISGVYAEEETAGNYIQLTGNNVNVRTSAPSGSVIDTVRENTCFKYSETKDVSGTTWYKIALGSVSGWISGSYCKVLSSGSTTGSTTASGSSDTATTTTTAAVSSGYLKMTGDKINVRGTAGTTGSDDVLTKVNKNAWFPFTAVTDVSGTKWYKITVGSDSGWVSGKYVSVATESANYIKITAENINVRTKAGTGDPICTVTINEYYPYTETSDLGGTTCYKITVGSKSGWVVGTYAEAVGSSSTGGTGSTQTTATTAPTAAPALDSKEYVQATAGAVNVRNAANGSSVVTTITKEMKDAWFKYSSTNTISGVTWYQIVIGSQIGWVSGSYVKPATTAAKYIRVTNNLVNVRNEVNGSEIVTQVPKNCCYPFTETKTENNVVWYKITIGDKTGWINGNYVAINDPDPKATTTSSSTTTTTTTTAPAPIAGTSRLAGAGRIATAIAISKEGWANGAESVVLASGNGYADALAGVSLAAALNAPILLTDNGASIESAVSDEIARLGAKKVYILGGTMVINNNIANALNAKYTVTRIAGANRYETAVAIAKELRKVTGKDFTTLYFASSANFPDALSISPVAAIEGNPVLYAPPTGALDAATAAYIKQLGCSSAVIVGGPVAISDDARNSIITSGITSVTRIYGAGRYETSLKINTTYSSLFTGKGIAIATGEKFPDALAGGALAAIKKIPVVLVVNGTTISGLKDYVAKRGFEPAYIYGGASVVSNDTVNSIIK